VSVGFDLFCVAGCVRSVPAFNDFQKMSSENVITQAIRNMGWKEQATGHGFRALARSTIEETGKFSPVAARALDSQK